jgi:hypothetical protein
MRVEMDHLTLTRKDSPSTVGEILSCDLCGAYLGDHLGQGMLYWTTTSPIGDPPVDNKVTRLMLAHKRCWLDNGGCRKSYSLELYWLADPAAALQKLSSLMVDYRWNAPKLQRVVDVAFAVSRIATPKEKKASARLIDLGVV